MTGGGESENFTEIDLLFQAKMVDKAPNLLFIPLACEKSLWNASLERIKTVFTSIDFNNIEMCINLDKLTWDYLKNFEAIYFDGGNTFQLMSEIRHTHTYELLHRFLNNGGIINGDSAGAIVLGSHLETAHFGDNGDENTSNIKSYQGLNLLGQYAIHCHYEESEDTEIKLFAKEYGFPIIALHENSAIYIENGTLKVIGQNKVRLFKNNETIDFEPGHEVSL